MFTALVVLILIVCLLLALVVLAQNPKGGGLSSQFGAGGAANLMGVKRTGDLLEKLTWGFAIGLIVLSLGSHMLSFGEGPARSINQQRAQQVKLPAPTAPATPAPGAAAPATAPAPAPTNTPQP
ncbi:preprotein translocase subunit SecG [Hymenobacter setariae]|uniref:Protein-export membrane protein SecG n=1 Tax=Hymenobacter setariae TaxID=2594794 RepID=A0A558C283_9BACT|nr:preprotein translocase subunit SecG [Hymenobacter setariae]TVT42792.1 preprotein translocase subunit SecG [Hymenobacter setariae]